MIFSIHHFRHIPLSYHVTGHIAFLQFWRSIVCSLFMAYGAREPAASATLDSPPKGCRQPVTDGDELRNRYLRYGRRRIGKRNIPLGDCQGHAPSGWLFSYLSRNLGTAFTASPVCCPRAQFPFRLQPWRCFLVSGQVLPASSGWLGLPEGQVSLPDTHQ